MNTHNKLNADTSIYSTNVLRGIAARTQQIRHEIELAVVHNEDGIIKDIGNGAYAIVGEIDRINAFLHPIIVKNKVYIDARGYYSMSGVLRNYYEFTLMSHRAKMDLAWTLDKEVFYGQEGFIVDAFSSWLSSGLQTKMGVGILTANNFRIIAAIYYLGIFNNEVFAKNEDIFIYLLKRLPRMLGIPAQLIDDLILVNEDLVASLFKNGTSEMGLNRVIVLAEALSKLTNEGIKVDVGVLYNAICSGAFIAANAIEITSIAIEHPPTFTVIMQSTMQKGSANTSVGRVIKNISRRHDSESFNKFFARLTSGI